MDQQSGAHTQLPLWHAVAVGLLVAACFVIARPFLGVLTWAVILAVSAWPSFVALTRVLRGRRRLAATAFLLAGMVVIVLPLILAGLSAVRRAPALMQEIESVERNGVPGPPDAVARLPLVGPRLHAFWADTSEQGSEVLAQYRQEINSTARWLLHHAGSFGLAVLQFALALIIACLLLTRAEAIVALLRSFVVRISGPGSLDLLPLAEHTIRAVSFGIVGTSLLEGALSAAGFGIAGVAGALLLGGATFLLCLLQAGPGLVFLPATIWMWWHGDVAWALFVLAWHLTLVLPVEMVGRPFFISRGTGLPMLLIFVGVLGGLLAFGLIGIFVGATILAVAYTMMLGWLRS